MHQQKLRVVYLPPEGQIDEGDEDDHLEEPSTILLPKRIASDVRFDHSSLCLVSELRFQGEATFRVPTSVSPPPVAPRPVTPPQREPDTLYREDSREESSQFQRSTNGSGVVVNVQPSPPPPPPPAPAVQINRELELKLSDAQAEIQRLRALLAAVPDPSSTAPESVAPESVAPSEYKRRYTASSEDGASTYYGGTDVGTVVDHDTVIHQEGVPLQVVIIIALGVFITTYLFF